MTASGYGMSSDSKRYGSSFGRPSGTGASSFGFEPAAANPLRSTASSDTGPKVYSSDAFDEPAASSAPTDYDAVDNQQSYDQAYEQGYEQDYDAQGYQSDLDDSSQAAPSDQAGSLRERIASRFSDSLSFSRSKPTPPDQQQEAFADPDYAQSDYSGSGYSESNYSDSDYSAAPYDGDYQSDGVGQYDDSYSDDGYGSQGFESETYSDQNYAGSEYAGGYSDTGFDEASARPAESASASGWRSRFANRTADLAGSQTSFQDPNLGAATYNSGYGDQGYDDQAYSGQSFGGQDYASQSYGAQGYDAQGYNSQGYNSQGYNSQGYNSQAYGGQSYNADGYGGQDYDAQGYDTQGYGAQGYGDELDDADLYNGRPGSAALGAGNSLKSPGLKRNPFAALDLSSKWIMPAGSIAAGVLVLAVLLYLFNPFAGNPLETPDSIATVETMLAALDIDPGAQDGIADDAYRLAIVEFQEMHGLAQTGELTPEVFQEMTAIYELSNL